MTVLVTGAAGQLGHDIMRALAGHDVVGTDHGTLDVGDRDAVMGAVIGCAPELIINAAAWTAVDDCESDRDRAYRTNGLAVRHLAEAARMVGAHLCHISTDYVFSGDKSGPYLEWDRPDPRSVYGASKLAGELELDPAATLVRVSWVCGLRGSNMVKTILRLAADHDELAFVDDQVGHPTFTADAAPVIVRLARERRPGIYHVTNQGPVSWYELARAVLEAAGHDPARVHPISTADLTPPRPAPRPANSVLDNAALRGLGWPELRPFTEPLRELVAQLTGGGEP